jgi:hypothetical protein
MSVFNAAFGSPIAVRQMKRQLRHSVGNATEAPKLGRRKRTWTATTYFFAE